MTSSYSFFYEATVEKAVDNHFDRVEEEEP